MSHASHASASADRRPQTGPGWAEVFISPCRAASTDGAAESVAAGHSLLVLTRRVNGRRHALSVTTEGHTLGRIRRGAGCALSRSRVSHAHSIVSCAPQENPRPGVAGCS
eukprot:CAMPEP_0185285398 /NCGR_PEP_ID=MMETSP1363-20130426/1693_1 /TAXON_ID=38817 /ORGANISM="Gephyrocapsa oceanica, Strain RCC1303" /LENGTH=109 /DNA_ID=CAMNT_0027881179 /DNA_START=152 /DNA_END=478 /DNA_ORIENTATION=+